VDFIETEPYEKGFAEYYQKEVLPLQKQIEVMRIDFYKKFKRILLLTLLTMFLFVGFLIYKDDIMLVVHPIGLLCMFILGFEEYFLRRVCREYNVITKNALYSNVVSYFKDTSYCVGKKIPYLDIKGSRILPNFDGSYEDDSIYGKHNGVGIDLIETQLTIDTNGRYEMSTFKGLFLLFNMGDVVFDDVVIGSYAKKYIKKKPKFFKNITLEDPVLNKNFNIYAKSQIEARVILDPAFMERLNQFFAFMKKEYNIKNIKFSLYNNKFFIMMPCRKNLFEPKPVWKSCIDISYVKTFLKQMNMMFEIAEILKMERKAR
jgi:hypothetical protein